MQLINIEKRYSIKQKIISLVVGMDNGKSFYVAKKKNKLKWDLYKNLDPQTIKKENLFKVDNFSTFDEVLNYIQGQGLRPFCPKQQLIQARKIYSFFSMDHTVSNLEKRRYFRKRVNLTGECHNYRTGATGHILIEDVSINGMKFKALGLDGNEVGDRLHLSFTLDNARKSLIKREVRIRHVNKNHVGVQYLDSPEYGKEVDFYLWACHG